MKHYVCITPFFPSPASFRGPYVLDQVKAIARNSDYNIVVFMPHPAYRSGGDDYTFDGIDVYRFKDYTLPSYALPNDLSDHLTYRSFRKKLKSMGIDPTEIAVCHAHVAHLGSTAVRLKRDFPHVKTVIQHHGFDVMSVTDGRLANYRWHKELCTRRGVDICNEADLNIGVSRATLDYVEKQPGIKLRDSFVLYNGVDTTKFHRGETPNKSSDLFTIGCVANFWELKDQMTLIKAIERLRASGISNLKVVFVGSGYTLAGCRQYVEDHSLSDIIEFRQEVSHRELADFYRSLDLFVLPSYWEAFGCVYTEAYACGVPFIGVKGQGIAELIVPDHQDRWLIDKGDDAALSRIIGRMMANPAERQILTRPIDIDSLVKEYIAHLQQ